VLHKTYKFNRQILYITSIHPQSDWLFFTFSMSFLLCMCFVGNRVWTVLDFKCCPLLVHFFIE